MPELLLTIHCGRSDAASIGGALRDITRHPVHQRDETVHGLDFSDATAAESVAGHLDRVSLEVRVGEAAASAIVAQIGALKRAGPVRWRLTPIIASGRFA